MLLPTKVVSGRKTSPWRNVALVRIQRRGCWKANYKLVVFPSSSKKWTFFHGPGCHIPMHRVLSGTCNAKPSASEDHCNGVFTGLFLKNNETAAADSGHCCPSPSWDQESGQYHSSCFYLYWLTVSQRNDFKLLPLGYKARNGLGPKHISDLLYRYEPNPSGRPGQACFLSSESKLKLHISGTNSDLLQLSVVFATAFY